jgi:hypothetical protein
MMWQCPVTIRVGDSTCLWPSLLFFILPRKETKGFVTFDLLCVIQFQPSVPAHQAWMVSKSLDGLPVVPSLSVSGYIQRSFSLHSRTWSDTFGLPMTLELNDSSVYYAVCRKRTCSASIFVFDSHAPQTIENVHLCKPYRTGVSADSFFLLPPSLLSPTKLRYNHIWTRDSLLHITTLRRLSDYTELQFLRRFA